MRTSLDVRKSKKTRTTTGRGEGPSGLRFERRFTTTGVDPFDAVTWEKRDASITNEKGEVVFEQKGVEVPEFWSAMATSVVVSKYFRGPIGTPERETSVKQVIGRVVRCATEWGEKGGYFTTAEDLAAFSDELKHLLLHQMMSFNSPVWFNVGIEEHPQCSACQPYDARVLTTQGPMAIGEIVEKRLVGLPVFDGEGLTQVVAVKHNGLKPVFRIELRDGHSVEATADHLVCAHDTRRTGRLEWRRVDALEPGMVMRVYPHAAETVTPPGEALEVSEAALAGWLQADGFVGQYEEGTNRSLTIEFMTNGDEEHAWIEEHLARVFPNVHAKVRDVETKDTSLCVRRIRLYGEVLRGFVEKYDLQKRGLDIRVPAAIQRASNDAAAAYLKSVFQAEGYAVLHGESAHVALAVISKKWVEDLQVLLTRFGVYARTRQKKEKREDRYDLWEVDVSIASERAQFARRIGFLSERKAEKLRESLDLDGKECPEIRYSEIVSIRPIGEMPVFDIQTKSGQYLSEGVLVHNCFILSITDDMQSIMNRATAEAMLFKFGSGSGINFSPIRGSKELLAGGGTASGPVSFMKGFDAFAGVIKSGGKTRRAAKMVILNVDHSDVREFIWCKQKEEKKAWTLIDAGYDPRLDGEAYASIFFQNSNNSVRVTDEFMRAVESDREWTLRAVKDGRSMETVKARALWRDMAEAAHACGDPGVQYDTTINRWHTCKGTGRINASNPCFTGDSLVYTDHGLVSFRDLIARVADGEEFQVYTHRMTAKEPGEGIVLSKPTQFMVTGVNEVYRLRFANGMEVRCTEGHRFWTTNRGWVEAKSLGAEDEVAVNDSLALPERASFALPVSSDWNDYRQKGDHDKPISLPEAWTTELAECLGHLTGDGSIGDPMVSWIYGSADDREVLMPRHKALLESITSVNHAVQPNGTEQLRVTRRPFTRFLEALGLKRARAAEKRVPDAILEAPASIIGAYLRGLFGADGCAYEGSNGTRYAGLGSKSLGLLQDVQRLLAAFGICARIYESDRSGDSFRYTNKAGEEVQYSSHGPSFDLRITGPSLSRFAEHIGFSLPRKNEKLRSFVQEHRFYESRHSTRLESMECEGPEVTYNLTEPLHHSYVVNGLIVRNCSEYMFLDDSACNLASLNLLKFVGTDGEFDVESFKHAVDVTITAQEIFVDNARYPTPEITKNSHAFRPLGLGYANLGALLMSRGLPYDSDAGRSMAAAITALMHGEAYAQSARVAARTGPFSGYAVNAVPMLDVVRMHRDACARIDAGLAPTAIHQAARKSYDDALAVGQVHGFKNSQVTVLAPTGTIAFMMDCDTTGVEPDIALVKYKKLVGGGMLKIVNHTVPRALARLGYDSAVVDDIVAHIDTRDTIEGAPGLREEHLPVFDCAFKPANGTRTIAPMGHVRMMGAVQPFLSGAISKTVNMPADSTVEDVENIYLEGWKLGLKAIAIYRDGCKRSQPLSTSATNGTREAQDGGRDSVPPAAAAEALAKGLRRRRLSDERQSVTHKFSIGGHEGYVTVGLYDDGTPGEIFVRMAKEGSTVSGLMDSFATMTSIALQYGVPLRILIDKFSHSRFEPSGWTQNPEIPIAKSITDYLFRWLALKFLKEDSAMEPASELGGIDAPRLEAAIQAGAALAAPKSNGNGHGPNITPSERSTFLSQADAPACHECGAIMVRSGSCYRCLNCAATSGCS